MELIVNKQTTILKAMNSKRRLLFVEKVLSNYNYQANDFDAFILETQKILKETHNIEMSFEETKRNFLINFEENILSTIWQFLHPQDKSRIGIYEKLQVNDSDLIKFIEYHSKKIVEYSNYVKGYGNGNTANEDIYDIYSYLAKTYGWTFDYINEMDEVELFKAIEQAIILDKRESISSINSQALASAYASGNKSAKSQVENLSRRLETDINIKRMLRKGESLEPKNPLSKEQLQKIMEGDNVR